MNDSKRALRAPPRSPESYRRAATIVAGDRRLAAGCFSESDAAEVAAAIRRPLLMPADSLAESLNDLTAEFFVRRAERKTPTDAAREQWCDTISENASRLLEALAELDARGRPGRGMSVDAYAAIAGTGIELLTTGDIVSLPSHLLAGMRSTGTPLGDTPAHVILDRAPAVLWALARMTRRAADEYKRRAAYPTPANRAAPERLFVVAASSHIYRRASGLDAPKAPNPTSPFTCFAHFICQRIGKIPALDRSASDADGIKDLARFTPENIAHLWRRTVGTPAADLAWQWSPKED